MAAAAADGLGELAECGVLVQNVAFFSSVTFFYIFKYFPSFSFFFSELSK